MYVTHDSHESAKYLVICVKTIIGKIMYRNFVEHQVFRAKNWVSHAEYATSDQNVWFGR